MFHVLKAAGFDVRACNHAAAILGGDFANETQALVGTLLNFNLSAKGIIRSGGGQAKSTQHLRDELYKIGWVKHEFVVQTIVDGDEREARSHEVDHVHHADNGTLALEIEWNNKDPFFDRDLENFQRLHAQGAISVGVVVTRGASLQAALPSIVEHALSAADIQSVDTLEDWGVKKRTDRQMSQLAKLMEQGVPFATAFAQSFVADKFGTATTHWSKLEDRVKRGVGNPCPLLLVGLPAACVGDYSAATPEL